MKTILNLLICITLSWSLHAAETVHLFVAGTGVVGSTLLKQIEEHHDRLQDRFGIDIRIEGIANSRFMQLHNQIQLPFCWDSYLKHIRSSSSSNTVFVDCTSSQAVADCYLELLSSGIAVVTANKKANSGPLAYYEKLQEYPNFAYDTNVGAGLPILHTISELVQSGDEVVQIEAVFSGTLSYIFNSFQEGTQFSDIVRLAQEKGYTEPDPRDDLNGMDFARKLLIVARQAGYKLELDEIEIQRFLPQDCFEAQTVNDFYAKLQNFDTSLTMERQKAARDGKRLLYIGSFKQGKASINLAWIGQDHPFYHLSGNDNIAAITTKYYANNPLVIQGPGAGASVTAAKVLQGIVRVGLTAQNQAFKKEY